MKVNKLFVCLVLVGLLLGATRAHALTIALPSAADTYLRDATVRGDRHYMDVRGGTIDFRGYLRFDLSALPTGAVIESATLNLFQVPQPGSSRNDNIVAARFALYGLNNAPGNTPQNWDEAAFEPSLKGTEDVTTLTGVTDLDDNVTGIVETAGGNSPDGTVSVSGDPLAAFLQTRYDDGGLATFILSNDDATDRGFGLGTKEALDPARAPLLTIEYSLIPEPASLALLGFAVVGLGLARRA